MRNQSLPIRKDGTTHCLLVKGCVHQNSGITHFPTFLELSTWVRKDCFHLITLHHIESLQVMPRMNVGPGGKQAKLRHTIWQGNPQCLTLPGGQPKRDETSSRSMGLIPWAGQERKCEQSWHYMKISGLKNLW